MSEAYCVKCKQKREVTNPEQVTMKNGRSLERYLPSLWNKDV